MAPDDFAPEADDLADDDLADDDFADDDFAFAPVEDDDFAFAPVEDGDLAFALVAAPPEDDRSDPEDFARAPDDDDLAFGRAAFLLEDDFGPGASVSFTPSRTRAPAFATASAPSATVSPIARSAPPACRPAPFAAFFTAFADALPAPPVVPLPPFFA